MALSGPETEYSADGPMLATVPDTEQVTVTRTIGSAHAKGAVLNRFAAPFQGSMSVIEGVTADAFLDPETDEARAAQISRVLGACAAEIAVILNSDTDTK